MPTLSTGSRFSLKSSVNLCPTGHLSVKNEEEEKKEKKFQIFSPVLSANAMPTAEDE